MNTLCFARIKLRYNFYSIASLANEENRNDREIVVFISDTDTEVLKILSFAHRVYYVHRVMQVSIH